MNVVKSFILVIQEDIRQFKKQKKTVKLPEDDFFFGEFPVDLTNQNKKDKIK